MNSSHDAVSMLNTVHSLPVMPSLLQLLSHTCQQEITELAELSHLIALDPGLTAKILHLTNASHFGSNSKVVTAEQAAVMLGLKQLQHIISVSTHQNPASRCAPDALRYYWRHSIATAFCARAIAQSRHMKQDYAYTAGLLHGIGDLLLLLHPDISISTAEGTQKPEADRAGYILARQWHFADAITEAILHFRAPPDDTHQLLASIVHLASAFVTALDICGEHEHTLPLLSTHAWDTLALTGKECMQIFRETEMHAIAYFDLLQI